MILTLVFSALSTIGLPITMIPQFKDQYNIKQRIILAILTSIPGAVCTTFCALDVAGVNVALQLLTTTETGLVLYAPSIWAAILISPWIGVIFPNDTKKISAEGAVQYNVLYVMLIAASVPIYYAISTAFSEFDHMSWSQAVLALSGYTNTYILGASGGLCAVIGLGVIVYNIYDQKHLMTSPATLRS